MTGGTRLLAPIELATMAMTCWKCQRDTMVVALIAAGVIDVDHDPMNAPVGACFVGEVPAQAMPIGLKAILLRCAPAYRPLLSRKAGNVAWRNACLHCNAALPHAFLHEHLTGPFFGVPSAFAGERQVIWHQDLVVDSSSRAWRGPHDSPPSRMSLDQG